MAIGKQLGGNTALDNFEHARQALAKNDLAQALFHVSSALATEPQNKEWRALLDTVLQKTPDPMVFVRQDEAKHDFITAATRAYVHAWKKSWVPAFETLASVVAHRPDAEFLRWMTEWVARPDALAALSVESVRDRILPPIVAAVGNCPAPCPKDDPRRATCESAVEVVQALYQRSPQEPFVVFAAGVVLRRVGRFDEAIQFAGYAFQLEKSWKMAIGVACANRDASKPTDAVAWFRHALSLDPNELGAVLDIGDTWLDAEKWDDAIAAYEEMLAKRPDDGWARASIAYARWKKSGAESDRDALFALADANQRARALLFRIYGDEPYFTWLPHPGDSTYHAAFDIMRQMEQRPPPATGAGVTVRLKHLEAPSALTAFKLFTQKKGWNNVGIGVQVEAVQTPDPRRPKKNVPFALWTFDDKVPRANAPAPDARAVAAVAEIAKLPYCLPLWAPRAQALAAQMGPAWINQLLCVMVHPCVAPDRIDPFQWMQRLQIAAALTAAYVDRASVANIAFGPVDWTVDAAIIALGWLAKSDASARPEVEAMFAELEAGLGQQGFTCYEYPLVNVWRNLGGHDAATLERLALWKKRCESQLVEFAEEKIQGLTLEQYAERIARGGGTIAAWQSRLNDDPPLHRKFVELKARFELAAQGIDANSHEGRVAAQIRGGNFDVQSAMQNQQAAAQAVAQGQGGDPDPLVFPGQKLAKLSDYVGLMKGMQKGDMNGALRKYGLDMNGYMQAAQAWGIKLASDPVLNQKFGQMMAG